MHTMYIGTDLHKHQFTCCYLKEKETHMAQFATNEAGYEGFKRDICRMKEEGYQVRVAVESTGNTRYFKNRIEALGVEVVVVNTLRFKVVNESVNKTDKRDAKTIAEFLAKDMLPAVNLSSEKSEKIRRLSGIRAELVGMCTKMKNSIHGILNGLGITTKAGQLNSVKGRKAVLEMITDDEYRKIFETIVQTIEMLGEQIKDAELKLEEMTKEDRAVEILKSIPGTGKVNAVQVRAYIDDIKRFSHYSKLAAYCGLVPWVKCSDETVHYGKITKRGPVELRTALVQMVLGMIRCKSESGNRLMVSYRKMKKEKGSGKAIIATARKLSKIIWFMLTNDDEYKKEKIDAVYDKISQSELLLKKAS